MNRTALITGISGQDGSYLAELLLENGYDVHGIVRRTAFEDASHRLINLSHLKDRIHLHIVSLDTPLAIVKTIKDLQPDECYHLAASSFVNYSFEDEISTFNTNVNTTHYLLAVLKEFAPTCRFYFAGTSEMFGDVTTSPQDENTLFNPRSIYGVSKLAGYHLVRNFRSKYGMFACTGILFNHESPRRGYEFVTRKIISSAVRIKFGQQEFLSLGNLDARRDWGYAPDYVKAMWLMLQSDTPDDYVVASNQTHSVQEFLGMVFSQLGLNYEAYVKIDPILFRSSEDVHLCGNPEKAIKKLGWKQTVTFEEMVREMVYAELQVQRDHASNYGNLPENIR